MRVRGAEGGREGMSSHNQRKGLLFGKEGQEVFVSCQTLVII